MKHQCSMWMIYVNWFVYLIGLFYLVGIGNDLVAAMWLLILPLGMRAYTRLFPMISVYLGCGDVTDKRSRGVTYPRVQAKVKFYTAGGCPFCPLVEQRLAALRRQMGFDLQIIHVIYRPELVIGGILAVPVVAVDGRQLVGNATTDELAALITGKAAAAAA
jgi:glutaredoxin